jgi:hypothetical protein
MISMEQYNRIDISIGLRTLRVDRKHYNQMVMRIDRISHYLYALDYYSFTTNTISVFGERKTKLPPFVVGHAYL